MMTAARSSNISAIREVGQVHSLGMLEPVDHKRRHGHVQEHPAGWPQPPGGHRAVLVFVGAEQVRDAAKLPAILILAPDDRVIPGAARGGIHSISLARNRSERGSPITINVSVAF